MESFPIIHTNFWDAVIAVPVVMLITQIIKIFTSISRFYIPSIANLTLMWNSSILFRWKMDNIFFVQIKYLNRKGLKQLKL